MNNPISFLDENGKFVGVVIAWGIGIGALEAGIEYLDQVSGGNIFDFSSYDFSRKIDGTKIIGAFGKGFCIGSFGVLGAGVAASASAAGATKLVQGAWTYGGNIAGGVLGGMTDRTITGDEPVDGDEMVKDGVLAGVGTWVSGKTSLYLMGKKTTSNAGATNITNTFVSDDTPVNNGIMKVMDAVKDGIGQQEVKEIYEGGSTESLKFQAPPSRDSRDNTSVNSNYQYRGK